MGHKDYTKQPEVFLGLLPSANANDIADLFAQGKSAASIAGIYRINGQKIAFNIIKTVLEHIKQIEQTAVNVVNGSSIIYNPPLVGGEPDPEDESKIINQTLAWEVPSVPTTKTATLALILQVVSLDGANFMNVYDADFSELAAQISHVFDNIIKAQKGGEGLWTDFYNAVK